MLFSSQYDGQCWGTPICEHHEDPFNLAPPPLDRSTLPTGMAGADRHIQIADLLAERLIRDGFATQGRFLSFAVGIDNNLIGGGGNGFYYTYNDCEENMFNTNAQPDFNDQQPAQHWGKTDGQGGDAVIVNWRKLRSTTQPPSAHHEPTIRRNNFWEDQWNNGLAHVCAASGQGAEPCAQQAQGAEPHQTQRAEPTVTAHWQDPIDWPQLLRFDSNLRQNIPNPCSRAVLDRCYIAFWKFEEGLRLIWEPPFDRLPWDDEVRKYIGEAYRDLLQLIVYFSAGGKYPNELMEELEHLFQHGEITYLGVGAGTLDGILAFIFREMIKKVTVDSLISYIESIGRDERHLAKHEREQCRRNVSADTPKVAEVRQFFDTLLSHELNINDQKRYLKTQHIWWDNGISKHVVDAIKEIIDHFDAKNVPKDDIEASDQTPVP